MAETAKVKSTGRLGVRYGVGIRKRLLKVESEQKKKHLCPRCGYASLKRLSKGIFFCKKCRNKFSGGAYIPSSATGRIIEKMVGQRKFTPYLEELAGGAESPEEKTGKKEEKEKKAEAEKPKAEGKEREKWASQAKKSGKEKKTDKKKK